MTDSECILFELPHTDPVARSFVSKRHDIAGNSTIGRHTLESLGVAVRVDSFHGLVVSAATPESMIRASSAIGMNRLLTLRLDHAPECSRIMASLPYPPPEEKEAIPAVAFPATWTGGTWLSCDLEFDVPDTLAVAAAQDFPLPQRWVTQLTMERLFEAFSSH
ncbi:hypothetical protein ACFL0I_01065 [Gemmatimonadota bacterium]